MLRLAVDPGVAKCGLALLDGECILVCEVVPVAGIADRAAALAAEHPEAQIILGDGTAHQKVRKQLAAAGLSPRLVSERDSTYRARALYWRHHPPRGWRRLVPRGLLLPPVPLDGWAAAVLALDDLARSP